MAVTCLRVCLLVCLFVCWMDVWGGWLLSVCAGRLLVSLPCGGASCGGWLFVYSVACLLGLVGGFHGNINSFRLCVLWPCDLGAREHLVVQGARGAPNSILSYLSSCCRGQLVAMVRCV